MPTSTTPIDPATDTAAGVLAAVRAERRTADQAEARLLALAVQWALQHPAGVDELDAATYAWRGQDTEITVAGPRVVTSMRDLPAARYAGMRRP